MPVFSAGGLGAFAVTTNSSQGISGTKTFTPLVSSGTPMIVQGLVSQTGNLLEVKNSAGTILTVVSSDGAMGIATPFTNITATYASALVVKPLSASLRGLMVQGVASQTGTLTEWQNSAGTIMAQVGPTGTITLPGTLQLRTGQSAIDNGEVVHAFSNAVGVIPLISQGFAGQTANLAEFRNSAGTMLARVDAGGGGYFHGSVQVLGNSAAQGVPNAGLLVGNDLWIYDVNQGNSIGFSGVGAPEAATIVLGRSSNAAGRISANDVNKTLVLAPDGGNDNSGQVVTRGSLFCARGDVSSNPSVQLHIGGASNTSGFTTQHNGHMRWQGVGTRHGDITYHPGEGYFRFRASGGSDFDQWATLLAGSFLAQSTEASKTNIATLEMKNQPDASARGSVKAPVGALRDRMKKLRPVSYNSAGNPGGDTLYSFVAEEAAEVVPEIVSLDGDGKPAGINVLATGVLTFALVQELMQRVEILEAELRSK